MKTSLDLQRFRVRSYELDPYSHLNNGVYVNWFEDARELFLRRQGRDWNYWPERMGLWFVVARIDCEYLDAALAAEELQMSTRLARIGNRSVRFRQVLLRPGTDRPIARAAVTMCFSREGRAVDIPTDFTDLFEVAAPGDVWAVDEGADRG